MFDYDRMIQRAIEFFPRWTDIRKRYKTSNGGNLLSAALDETLKIEEAIQEYIDSYFLETYEGHEDEVMAFSYMANIGKIDSVERLSISYDSKLLMLTKDTRLFNKDKYDEYVYYEDGKLFIKESLYKEGIPLTIVIDNNTTTEYQLVKYHVWNIFDEFATFVNTRRYEDETNKQLLDRILYITKNLPNASEKGLKDAIISELMFFDPEVKPEDIKIERATPENLRKPYENFESLLDKMMYVNRDVYKCKRWDFDYWQYNFESISYIPHKWDEVINAWQNGIGHGNDLEVVIADNDNITDAKITLYNKSLKSFEKYVYNKDIDYNINFQLTRYNNILNKSNIKYKLKASELVDITNENINLHLYEAEGVSEARNADELYSFGRGIKMIDNATIPSDDINWYKLCFKKKDDVDFKITKAYVRYVHDFTGNTESYKDLLVQRPGFLYNAEKELVSAINKKTVKRAEEFQYNNGFVTTDKGIALGKNKTYAEAALGISNYAGMYMELNYSCDKVDLPHGVVKSKGTYWNDNNELVIRGNYSVEDKIVEIELDATTFEFEVISSKITGRSVVTVIDNGIEQEPVILDTERKDGKNKFAIRETIISRRVKIIINTLSFNDIVLGNFKYSSFNLNLETNYGVLAPTESGKYLMPSIKDNTLKISIDAFSGNAPVIHGIYFGDSIQDVVYTTDYISSESLCSRTFDIKTTADISLLRIKPLNEENIAMSFLNLIFNSYGHAYKLFKDNVETYLKTRTQELLKQNDTSIINTISNATYEIINAITTILVNEYLKADILIPYYNKLFVKNEVLDKLYNGFIKYIEEFIYAAKDIEITIPQLEGKILLSEIFPELNKNKEDITIMDKAEWHNLAYNFADELLKNIEDSCMEDLGPFNPRILYQGDPKALNGESYIRLDLTEYESVTNVVPDGGKAERIEESGKVFYNINLEKGAIVSSITIIGTKNREAREIPLIDMITYHIPDFDATYDRILCSKLLDSVVVSRVNPGGTPFNSLIKLGSDMLTGIYATKYELELPQYIGCRYGNHTLGSNDNPVHYNSFDYISFYPAKGVIYEAINEYNSYIEYNRNIEIVNNFSPELDMNKLLVYTIENMNDDEKNKYILRFHDQSTEKENIYSLDTWSVGKSYIAIHNNIDLQNDINYSVNTYDINRRELLSSMIDIKDTYTISKNLILDTTQYIVTPPTNTIIKYEEYNGTVGKSHLLKTEEIIIDSNRFNKLVYSNIDTIFHMSKSSPNTSYIKDDYNYNLLAEQGILIWDNEIPVGTKLYLVYSIKKPIGFLIDLNDLYKAIDYDVEAYNRLDTILLSNIGHDTDYNLSKLSNIDDIDLVHVDCSNPTFEGVVAGKVIKFRKYINEDYILVKSGYYYINGLEYFLYSEDEDEDIVNNKYYGAENINISGGEIITYKPTNNFVNNTEMRLRGKAGIYNYDCKQNLNYGVSNLNTLTACDSFNEWTYFSMNPKLVAGANGMALQFKPDLPCSYAYLDITNSLIDKEVNYISLLATEDLIVHLGEEEPYLDLNFNRSLNLVLKDKIPYEGSDVRILPIVKKPELRYYLVVQGAGILDDIIITTNKFDAVNGHVKNIDLLGLDLLEYKVEGTEYRMSIDDNKDYSSYEAALMSDGYFKTTSKLDWYITKIASFEKEKDFYSCNIDNLNITRNYINTNKLAGELITPPIFINNQSTIKRLIFKINDIELDQLAGFNTIIYTSDTYDGNYMPIGGFNTNKGHVKGDALLQYIKLKIEIPANKIINNIHLFAEYTSTAEHILKLPLNESGYIITKIYDLQETLDYRLKDLGIDDVSNINDIELYIRASRDIEKLEVWHDWQRIDINNNLSLANQLKFIDVRFMQLKILLKTRQTYIKFNHLDVEVI